MSTEPAPPTHHLRRDRAVARLAARGRWYRRLAELYHQQLGFSRRAGARLESALRSHESDIAWLKSELVARDGLVARLQAALASRDEAVEWLRGEVSARDELRAVHSSRLWAAVQAYRNRPGARGLLRAMRVALRPSAPPGGNADNGG